MTTGWGRRFICGVVFLMFAWAGSSWSAEYREFRNQAGKAIRARIVQYDTEGGRVQLELKNRKKAWIEISTLSTGDREFIEQWHQEKTTEKTISEEEVLAIAEQYLKMIGSGKKSPGFKSWKKLFGDLYGDDENRFDEGYYLRSTLNRGSGKEILEVDGLNVKLRIGRETGWLQLLPDGKIKYDPCSFIHPLVEISQYVEVLANPAESPVYDKKPYVARKRLGTACFDFDSTSELDRMALAKKICDWLVATGGEWDSSEPKLKLPADQFEEIVGRVKQIAYPEIQPQRHSEAYEKHLAKWKNKPGGSGTTVSSKEAHDIAELYILAINGNYALWYNLFSPCHQGDPRLSETAYNDMRKKRDIQTRTRPVAVGATHGNHVEILVDRTWCDRDGETHTEKKERGGLILLLPDGRIKYDSLTFPHPYSEAARILSHMAGNLRWRHDEYYYYQLNAARRLNELGIPLFGFDPDASESKQKRSIAKIADWLQGLDTEWDASEPKVALPLDQFHAQKKGLGSY